MLRKMLLPFVLIFFIPACALFQGDLSPRQRAVDLATLYEPVQIAVEIAVNTSWVQARPTFKQQLQVGSRAATDAVLSYIDSVKGCQVEPETGFIIEVEGYQCHPSLMAGALQTAMVAIGSLSAGLAQIPKEE